MEYSFDIPVKIRIAKPPEFQSAIVDLARNKVCVFLTSTNMVQRLGLSEFINTLKTECKFQLIEYSGTNPTEVDIKNVVDKIEQLPELIIALGGGSILDLAKAVSAFSYMIEDTIEVEEITAAIKSKKYLQYTSKIELAAVATTSGTGSEVTRWATIWNYEHEEKFSRGRMAAAKVCFCCTGIYANATRSPDSFHRFGCTYARGGELLVRKQQSHCAGNS